MICVSIADSDFHSLRSRCNGEEFVEIRLDAGRFSNSEINELFAIGIKTVATFRPGDHTDEARLSALKTAIAAGAAYVDIEYESGLNYRNELVEYAKGKGCSVIISYHNYEQTPTEEVLIEIIGKCFAYGADVAKIACMANDSTDVARLLALYNINKRLVIIGMGNKGKITRVAAPFLGAEFTFAGQDSGEITAPGQLKKNEMLKIVEQLK
jgi:3-dehydroquinate dehydratase I